ncbi:hypothetical protein ADUPG1_004372, partial [Aduncisulcus paluster]
MEVKVQIQDMVDKLLFWALKEENADLVADATKIFLKGSENESDLHGFNDWFVHDYRTSEDKSIADLYTESQN